MGFAHRLYASVCAAGLAIFVAKALGVPWWLSGVDYGDQADFGMAAFILVLMLTRPQISKGQKP